MWGGGGGGVTSVSLILIHIYLSADMSYAMIPMVERS